MEDSRFSLFLERYGDKRIAIATHERADADAIASAFALSRIIPQSTICTSDEMSQGARMLCERFGIKTQDLSSLRKSEFEGLVVVDTSAYTLLPQARGWPILLIIDHHQAEGRDMSAQVMITDGKAASCAEMIASLIKEIDKESAFALAVAIISDGARFKSARAESFLALGRLMIICDAPYSELLEYAEPEPREEAKAAILKAFKNMEYVFSEGHIIATSQTTSNESDSASLITEAADVAFVAKWKPREQETRISARARKSCKVPLNKVMAQVGKELGGAGGGHEKAAGAALKAHTDEALKKCVEVFLSLARQEGR